MCCMHDSVKGESAVSKVVTIDTNVIFLDKFEVACTFQNFRALSVINRTITMSNKTLLVAVLLLLSVCTSQAGFGRFWSKRFRPKKTCCNFIKDMAPVICSNGVIYTSRCRLNCDGATGCRSYIPAAPGIPVDPSIAVVMNYAAE
eukprot:TRINITY_DN3863_c2_g1_i1.p3 TRINITY_DN3863_c2_g1~~TRINITY_DN3863_c2_g1_i1.p3  ORF type:complete len:145 (+),score=2.56 TRINITY_DN3863_c2_g1_i1:67-501(+)